MLTHICNSVAIMLTACTTIVLCTICRITAGSGIDTRYTGSNSIVEVLQKKNVKICSWNCFIQELTVIKTEEDKELERLRQKELFLKYQLESLM